MFKLPVFCLIGLFGVASIAQAAGTNQWIRLGNVQVHPTRILAKVKGGAPSNVNPDGLRQIGSRIHHQYRLVPGLAVLEEANSVALAAVSPGDEETQRKRLLTRIASLRQSGLFEYVEPDYIVHADLAPTDQAFVDGTLWGLRNFGQNRGTPGADIGATNAWEITTGSTNVIVAVIDTGIRYTHQDLASQMWHNPGEIPGNGRDDDGNGFVDDVFGINAITRSGDPMDDNDHGTHVSGTIGAAATNGHPHVGVTWHVQLMGCKFLSAGGGGMTSDAIICIDYAVNMGAKVMNNSWGGGAFSQALLDAIDRARDRGVLFVAAAGNFSINHDLTPVYPASYQLDNIIAVAALDRNDRLADFSDYGQTTVHLGAPGVEIFSSSARSDTDYQVFDGTSQATPHVTGVAALILSQYPGADMDEVRGRILAGVVPIPSLIGKTITGGRLNAYNSLTAAGSDLLQLSVNPPSGATLLTSSAQPIFVKVKDIFGVTNATVTGTIQGVTNLTFVNNGQPPDALAGDSTYSALLQVPASTAPFTITLLGSAPGKVSSTNQVTYTVVPPPPNDNFTNATKLPANGALVLSNNKFATIEPNEPAHAGVPGVAASLWWTWSSPTSNTNVLVDATGSFIDAVVSVYSGRDLPSLQPVASAVGKFSRKKPAYLNFNAQAGVTYSIAVSSVDENLLGSIRLRVAPGGALDNVAPAVFISSPSSGVSVNNKVLFLAGAALDPTPNSSGIAEVVVKVNDAIASSASGTTNWNTAVLLRPGANLIQALAFDAAGNSSPGSTIQVSYLPIGVPNDLVVNAFPLSDANSADTTGATKEVGEPPIAGNHGGSSVWWTFVPQAQGIVTLSTTNSTFDTLLALYTTNSFTTNAIAFTNFITLASNDDAYEGVSFSKISQAVRANRRYWVTVDGFQGASGTARLNYSFVASNIVSLTVNTIELGSVVPGSGDYPSGSTIMLTATPNPNYEFVAWEGDMSTSANPLSIVANTDLKLIARFRAHAFTDGFEPTFSPALGWVNDSSNPWVTQSNYVSFGQSAARSGAITDYQSSTLRLSITSGGGVGSFDYKVSSEPNWDWLEFYVNGAQLRRWSGEVGWATYQYAIAAGTNSLEWRYVKDSAGSAGLDAAFIDNVDIPPLVTSLQLLNPTVGGFQVLYHGPASQSVRIQGSANLLSWQDLSTIIMDNGAVVDFNDPQSANYQFRFYRAVTP
jgi:subtilisin family serine protease